MLACSKKGRTWFSIDLTESAERLGEPRSRLVAALEFLAERGDLVLKVSGVRHGYRVVGMPDDIEALSTLLSNRFQESEARDISRLHGVLELAGTPGCTTRALLAYFGEDLGDDCGHCDRCAGEAHSAVPQRTAHHFEDRDRSAVVALQKTGERALASSRQMARFLCGLPSPAATKAKLRKHPEWGRFEHVPFAEVIDFVERASA